MSIVMANKVASYMPFRIGQFCLFNFGGRLDSCNGLSFLIAARLFQHFHVLTSFGNGLWVIKYNTGSFGGSKMHSLMKGNVKKPSAP